MKTMTTMPRFVKPTVAELEAYAKEIGYGRLDAQRFLDHYEMVGWKVGRVGLPMRDWRAAVRTWRRNERQWKAETTAASEPVESPEARRARLEKLDARLLAEYAERVAACRSWLDADRPAPMGDPREAERRLMDAVENKHGRQFRRRLEALVGAAKQGEKRS